MSININLEAIFGTTQNQSESVSSFSTSSNKYQFKDQISSILPQPSNSVKLLSTPQQKIPGERLYYQHKKNQDKKIIQIQKIKQLNQIKQRQIITGIPQMNPNSIKILEKKKMNTNNYNPIKKNLNIKPTKIIKQQQQLKNCTFKPQLIAKHSNNTFTRNQQKVFEQLFNDYKVKQIKKKLMKEQVQQNKILRKISKAQFQAFIQRNQKFIQKVHKKQQIFKNAVHSHDLKSGMKLFSPKINRQSDYLFPSNKPKKSYLNKSVQQQQLSQTFRNNSNIFNKYKNDQNQIIEQNLFQSDKYTKQSKNQSQYNKQYEANEIVISQNLQQEFQNITLKQDGFQVNHYNELFQS